MVDELSELEAQRKARIDANKQKLLELNLGQHASALHQTTPRKRPLQPKTPASAPVASRRLSDRVRNITPISFNLEKVYRMSRFAKTGKLTRSDRKQCDAEELANLRNGNDKIAQEAAEDIGAASPSPGVVRPMLPSHVSGGYWLQMTMSYHKVHMPQGAPGDKHNIYLRLKNRPELPLWDVVYLSRPGGSGGLSGGWRGFAIDLELRVGDAVLFEKPLEDAWVYEVTVVRAGETEANEIDTENIHILMQEAGLDDEEDSLEEDTHEVKPKKAVKHEHNTVEDESVRVKTPQVAELPRTKRGKRVVTSDEEPTVVVKKEVDNQIPAATDDIESSVMEAFQSALAQEHGQSAALAGGNIVEDVIPNLAEEERERKPGVSSAMPTSLQKQVAPSNALGATLAKMGTQAEGTKLRIFSATLNTWSNGVVIRYCSSDISHEIHFEDNTIVTYQLWDLQDDELELIEEKPTVAGQQLRLTDYYRTMKASQTLRLVKAEK